MAISYTEHKKEGPPVRNPPGFLESQHPSQAAESPPYGVKIQPPEERYSRSKAYTRPWGKVSDTQAGARLGEDP